MLKIGLTGGIGSGKSTVCRFFEELGIPVIDADVVARNLTEAGQPALRRISDECGSDTINKDGSLNRELLRQRVFSDASLRKKLEDILHPLIKKKILDLVAKTHTPYLVIAIPLLIERNWLDLVDRVLVVDTSIEQQIQRSKTRDKASETQIRSIIRSQTDRDTRIAIADDIIYNNSDLAQLRQQVVQLHQRYLSITGNQQ